MTTACTRLPMTQPAQLRAARRWLHEHDDELATAPTAVSTGAPDALLARSWQRSRHAGLTPCGRTPGAPHASGAQLARALQRQHELVSHARPVMEFMFPHVGQTASLVILADADGMLLHTLGDTDFTGRAERVALRPGACWLERWRGTNAIGTALAEAMPMVVHGGEHYLQRNGFLTCAAAPIIDPGGALLGVLDISGEQRSYHPHTLGLARSAARMVEHRLFETRHAHGLRLRLHAQPHGLGTLGEGLLALTEDGWIIGANGPALETFGLARESIGHVRVEDVLGMTVDALRDSAPRTAPGTLGLPDGRRLWARLETGSAPAPAPITPRPAVAPAGGASLPATPPHDALAALDTGDAAMRAAIDRARRVLDKPIALLLQGESGAGKEVFARALHATGARRDAPFVAVNCAALPEALIEAELFGYRPGAYTGAAREGAPGRIREADGGTLFLDEIGDMPLALQARLLRVLQDRQVVPLGGGKPVPVDFKLVCATHRPLRTLIDDGRFREDLYYRLNGLALQLPPLRERQDLQALIARMLAQIEPGRGVTLAPELAGALAAYRWPGNLRQLHNALATACALLDAHETRIDWPHLSDDLAADLRRLGAGAARSARPEARAEDLRQAGQRTVRQAVQASAGNLSEAARRLGISRNTLYRRLRELAPEDASIEG